MSLPALPDGPVRVVIDTDAANEIDDQFAIAWALLSRDRLRVEGIASAPFCHGHFFGAIDAAGTARGGPRTRLEALAGRIGADRAAQLATRNPPAEGEARSRAEIHRILDVMGLDEPPPVWTGSDRFMDAPDDVVDSGAARSLIERAHAGKDDDGPLHVATIGAPTNVASALLLDPSIADRMVVLFLAGYPSAAPHADDSFNLVQDRHATNVLFESGVPLVYLPGYHVAEVLGFSVNDSERWVKGRGPLGDLLHQIYLDNPIDPDVDRVGRSWVMWDLIAIAWLIDPSWVPTFVTGRARVTDHHTWEPADGTMLEAYRVERDALFADLLAKLEANAA